jgi:hypothetical protein
MACALSWSLTPYKSLENKRVVDDDILPALDAVPVIEKSPTVCREWAGTEKKWNRER